MTLQWTAVALFLYAEVVASLILCIPFISAKRWHQVFSWGLWNWLSPYWNKCFWTMIMVLIVLFLDAVREVQKYSGPEPMQDAKVNPNVFDHVHMKLFRAQRNLYISGFSLFLWLVMRRVVTLLNRAAVSEESSAALQAAVDKMANEVKQREEDHNTLRQTFFDEENTMAAKNQQLKLEIQKLESQLKTADSAVQRSQAEVEAMKRQAKGLAQEYDRLLSEHHQLQNQHCASDKKDQ